MIDCIIPLWSYQTHTVVPYHVSLKQVHVNDVLLSLKSGMTDLEKAEQVLPPCSGDWYIVINTVNGVQTDATNPYGDNDNKVSERKHAKHSTLLSF